MTQQFRSIIIALIALLAPALAPAQDASDSLFPLPEIPSEIALNERPDYVITHYWDKCNFKSVMSSKDRYVKAFDTYVDMMKVTSRHATMRSIHLLLEKLDKYPEALLYTAELAESMMYGPTASFPSDEAYLPFARAVAANKKISRAEKARFDEQARIISGSSKGMPAPDLNYIDRDGTSRSLAADTAAMVIIFFNDPDCIDCIIARGHMAANPNFNTLIDNGILKIVALTPDDVTEEWSSQTDKYPASWTVGAAPDAYDTYDIRHTPTIYILDSQHNIIGKDVSLDELMNIFTNIQITDADAL